MKQFKSSLYALNKDKSIQVWDVFTDKNKVIVLFGKVGGKIQRKETICESKNVGRSNETTAEEQALLEAESKYNSQVRTGYRESVEDLITTEQFSPMLAKDASKVPHLIEYPCHVSAKLDGLRCLITFNEEGEPIFNSRGNKTYPIQGKIIEQIKELRKATGFDMFDGEMYLHGLSLQKISSLAKKWRTHEQINAEIEKDYQADIKRRNKAIDNKEPTWKDFNGEVWTTAILPVRDTMRYDEYESTDLEFHIFDIPSDKFWYSEQPSTGCDEEVSRYGQLAQADHIVAEENLDKIKFVFGEIIEDQEDVKECIGEYMQQGFEGAIIRNFKGLYEFNQRSSDLLKWKIFSDTEAKVVAVEPDKNQEGVLICEDKDGIVVRMKVKGTHEERLYENQMKNIGKFINFTYQARTDDNNYSFPVGQYFREVNPASWEVQE